MITGQQVGAARALLKLQVKELAKKTNLSEKTIVNIENCLVKEPRAKSLNALQDFFEQKGIEFIETRGVAFRDSQVKTLHGNNVFVQVLDDVIASLRGEERAEALFACVDDSVSPPHVVENYRRLRSIGIAMRSLVKKGNTFLMGNINEYRYIPEEYFHNNAIVIYGNKIATMILQGDKDSAVTIIDNPSISSAQRNLFNFIWSITEKPIITTAKVRYD